MLERILRDKRSGQTKIMRDTIELLKNINDADKRIEICEIIRSAHKAIAGLRWILKMLKDGKDPNKIEMEMEKADEICVERLRDLVRDGVVLTISRSHTLERGLTSAKHVIVLESSPEKEGIDLMRYLKGRGISSSVFPDCAMAYAVKLCDIVVVGADCVLKDGFINKTGTLPFT